MKNVCIIEDLFGSRDGFIQENISLKQDEIISVLKNEEITLEVIPTILKNRVVIIENLESNYNSNILDFFRAVNELEIVFVIRVKTVFQFKKIYSLEWEDLKKYIYFVKNDNGYIYYVDRINN